MQSVYLMYSGVAPPALAESVVRWGRERGLRVMQLSPTAEVPAEGEVAATVLLPGLPRPLALARRLHRALPTAPILIVADASEEAALRSQLRLAPLLGDAWRIVAPDGAALLDALETTLARGERRRTLRTTIERFNVRLAAAPGRADDDYRKLVVSDRLLASILEHAQDTIVSLDLRGIISSWNEGACAQYGFTRAEVIGKPAQVLAAAGDALMAAVGRVAAGGAPERLELEALRADGSSFFAEFSLGPVRDADGRVIGVSLLGRDVSERVWAEQRLERKVAERTAELRELNRELESFSYSVSHDLRAPLRSVQGFSQVLLEDHGALLDATAQQHLSRIAAAAEKMGNLIDDLLDLARLSRTPLTRAPVDLSAAARRVLEERQQSAPERRVSWHVAEGLSASGDARLLAVALENLLGNAWKFTAGRDPAYIAFGCSEGVYFVRDDGAGFDMAYADKLFAPFQRLHRASEFEGTGIGLATVQRIIHRHGGKLWAESMVGRGATFFFTLPAPPPAAPDGRG